MRANGGLISRADLALVRLRRRRRFGARYRGTRIATNNPPGGGIMLIEMLNILEQFDLAAIGHNSPEYIRIVSEAMKIATADKDAHVGDPRFVDVPVQRLTSKDYARADGGADQAAGENPWCRGSTPAARRASTRRSFASSMRPATP